MKSSLEPLEGNKVKVYVEVDEAEFDRDIDRAFRTIAREVKLPGFRNGKVPRRVLEARIGLGPAREQALRDAIPEYLSKAVRELDVDLVATPAVELTGGQEEGLVEFEAECEIRPEITVPGYGGLRIELDSPLPTPEELDEARAAELKAGGTLVPAGRPAELGDFLTLDIAAGRDGEEVPGLNAEDWSYELGQGWVAEDFDDHLVGASEGDELTFTTTPKGTEEAAEISVKVSAVQTLELPELTDDWVAENTGEFETVAEWDAAISDRISEQKLAGIRQQVVGRLTESLVQLVDVDPPESMVTGEMQNQAQNMARQFQSQGIDLSAWLSATGQDMEQFLEGTRPQAEQAVKADLALRAVAVAEDIEVGDDDIEAEYARMAMQFNQKAKEIRKIYERNDAVPELIAQIRKSKAMDWLLHQVEMVDHDGAVIDRDLVLGHTHDHDDDDAPDDLQGEAAGEPTDDAGDEPTDEPNEAPHDDRLGDRESE